VNVGLENLVGVLAVCISGLCCGVDAPDPDAQIEEMSETDVPTLEKLALKAAEAAAGSGSVERVEVVSGEDDSDRPAYYFTFLIDEDRAQHRPGLVLTRLIQRLSDDLIAISDGHYPVVRILNRTDWDRRGSARRG
jgi:hypothetical protein